MKRGVLVLLFAAITAMAQTAPKENSFEIYPIGLSDGAAIETMAKAMVGADGTVTLDAKNQRLLVLATKEQHQKIAELVSKTAVSPKNVRIDVVFSRGDTEKEKGAGVTGGGSVEREDGITHVRWKIKPQVIDRSVQSSDETRQQLLVSSGHAGQLRIGSEVPYASWFMDYGISHGIIGQQINWKEVGSFLLVEPTVIGDGPLVRVKLTPQLSGLVNGSPYNTQFASVATEVTVADGEPITIGGGDKDREFYSRFLVGFNKSGGTSRLSITLTPHIMSLPAPTAPRTQAPARP